jgi:CBS domain containing-hemolysin-like protein
MTWGYWGIVSGLLIFLGIFFVAMEILYARARNGSTGRQADGSESGKAGKHAA